jgi:hypothetical protein
MEADFYEHACMAMINGKTIYLCCAAYWDIWRENEAEKKEKTLATQVYSSHSTDETST